MRFYGDASFVVALYRESRFSPEALRIVARYGPLLHVSPLTRLEVVRALARDKDPARLARFRADLGASSKVRTADVPSWPEALRVAETWAERAGKRLATGATDTLVVALASLDGATHLCSFDRGSHQRVIALHAGMSVLPAPSRDEKALARAL
jgi:predicted nucleic acid-binding protein